MPTSTKKLPKLVGSKFCQVPNEPSKITKAIKNLQKWRNFAKFGHAGSGKKKNKLSVVVLAAALWCDTLLTNLYAMGSRSHEPLIRENKIMNKSKQKIKEKMF